MQSEEGRFKTLLASCQGSDMAKIYHDFYYWLDVVDPKLSRVGFRGISEVQPSFSDPLRELEKVLAVPEQAFDKIGFTDELKKLRKLLLKQQQVREQGLPQNINPMMA